MSFGSDLWNEQEELRENFTFTKTEYRYDSAAVVDSLLRLSRRLPLSTGIVRHSVATVPMPSRVNGNRLYLKA